MKKVIKLTESDLTRLVKRVIKEQGDTPIQQSPNNQGNQGTVGQGGNQEYIINNLDDLSKVIYQMVNIGGKGRILRCPDSRGCTPNPDVAACSQEYQHRLYFHSQ